MISSRREHYFRCPDCGAKLRAALVRLKRGAKVDWLKINWHRPNWWIAGKYGIGKNHVSQKRREYAPETLRPARTRQDRRARRIVR